MKSRLFQSLRISLLLVSGTALVGSLYALDQIYSRGMASQDGPQMAWDQNQFPLKPAAHGLKAGLSLTLVTQASLSQSSPEASLPTVDVCVDLPDWQRPAEQIQRKRLEEMERYHGLLEDETLMGMVKDWWSHEAFWFTTYGLSARTDPHYLSGIWTALDHIWDCYSGDQPQQINNGELAELWLLHHRFVNLQWQGDRYLVTVEPSTSGLQILQFQRQENLANSLPITLMTPDGREIAAMSGNW